MECPRLAVSQGVRCRRMLLFTGREACYREEGTESTFDFEAFAEFQRVEGEFVLVGVAELECWVIGEAGQNTLLKIGERPEKEHALQVCKITVGRMYNDEDRERLRRLNPGRRRLVCYWQGTRPIHHTITSS